MDIPNPDLLMEFIFLDRKFQSMMMILKILIFLWFLRAIHFDRCRICISRSVSRSENAIGNLELYFLSG